MNQNLGLSASLAGIFYEPISDPEMLLGVLGVGVVDGNVQIFKVFLSLGVLAASHIEDVRYTHFQKLLGLEGRLVRTHYDTRVDLEKVDLS